MILIPQRLFGQSGVKSLLRDGNVCILEKQLNSPVIKREGYISNHVIAILLEGQQQIKTYEEEVIKMSPGEVLFIPRGVYHITDLIPEEGQFRSLLFYFDDAIIQQFLATSKITEVNRKAVPSHLKFGMVPTLSYFAETLINIYDQQSLQDKSLLPLKILELLHLLDKLTHSQAFANFLFKLTLPQKRNIRSFMDNNYDKPLKIEDYAYLTGRSVSTFRRDFKSYYDTTPQKWLQQKRMDKALTLVEQQSLSVTELAYEVGYENISYFIKAFKNKVGLSPKQYMLARNRNQLRH
jgi:AraC-like DNA-binding protein